MASGVGAALEELPHDGTCDQCEPDEGPGAEEVCRECGFCYCRRHAEGHRLKFPGHHLAPYMHGAAQAWAPRVPGEGAGQAGEQAPVEEAGDLESEAGEESESREDSDSEEESETEEESEGDSEEDMEDEQESEAEEDNHGDGESEAEGETEAESEFDPEIEMEAERVAQRRCPDHGLDLSTYCQEDTQLICVLCPVIGAHQGHQLSTLDEAFEELRVSIGSSGRRPRGQGAWVSTQVVAGGVAEATFALITSLRPCLFRLLGAVGSSVTLWVEFRRESGESITTSSRQFLEDWKALVSGSQIKSTCWGDWTPLKPVPAASPLLRRVPGLRALEFCQMNPSQ